MPVIGYDDFERAPVAMEGSKELYGAEVIGAKQGWSTNILRVFRLKPGGFSPKHSHNYEHVNFVITGKGKLQIGDTLYNLEPHTFAFVPPNVEHQYQNPYDEDFEFICIIPTIKDQK